MANRSITVTLRANVQDFKSQFDAATKAAENAAKGTEAAAKQADTAMGRMVQSARDNREAWTTAGATLTGFGAATLGGLGLATKAAMDWESAFAGVRKTVDASEAEFAALEAGLRGMARELPASHQEIAAVAEAAGQLGIATPNILGFTRTMIDLGESTNMSAEQAATSLSRFMNIMGTSQGEVGRLGASVVGLGNNFATTESEIVDLSMRLAGAGAQAGLTEGDIMGMAAAMSSVGIEAEAGGTAMSLTMKRIGKEVETGGDKLELFAQVAGMSAEEFSTAWRERPAEALDAFVNGLARTEQMGMSTNAVLSELGITGIRESDALLRLSSATGLLSDAMALGNDEYERGIALIEEANQRYQTAESRIGMAKNAITDAAISIGGTFLPVVAEGADAVADFAGYFADLPGPIHTAVGGLAGVAGAASLAGGAFLLTFPRVMDTVSAFRDLAEISPRAATGIGKVSRVAGKAAAAFVALSAAGAVAEMFSDTAVSAEEMSSKLANLAATATVTAADIDGLVAITGTGGASVKDFGYALESVNMGGFMKALDATGSLFGVFDSDVSLAKEQIASLDQALSTFAMAGTMDHLAESFNAAVESAAEYGFTAEDVIEQMPGLRTALEPIATQLGLTADNATLAKIASGELVPVFDEATGAATGFAEGMEGAADATQSAADAATEALSAMADLANEFINAERGALDYADAMEEAGKAAAENGKHWEDGTQKADDNKRALLDLADQAWATADAFAADNKSGTFLKQAREDLINTMIDMGAGREEAERYADQLLATPAKIQTQIDLDTAAAQEKWDEIFSRLWPEGGHPPMVIDPVVDPEGKVPQFTGVLDTIPPEVDVSVDADTSRGESNVRGFEDIINGTGGTVVVDAHTYYAEETLRDFQRAVNETGGTVTINGDTMYADEALDTLVSEINAGNGTVTIDGQSVPAQDALQMLTNRINDSGGTVTIEGNNAPANAATDRAKAKADGTTGTIDVNANTGRAESGINRTARDRSASITASASTGAAESALQRLTRGRTTWVTVRTTGNVSALNAGRVRAVSAHATGGPINGPGTGTSDSVPILASNGEHMLTAKEVALAGGHQAIYSLRQQLLAGAKTLHLATGGGIEDGRRVPAPAMSVIRGAAPQAVSAQVDSGAIASAVAAGARQGIEAANITALVSDRVAAGLHQRGRSASRAYGGGR